MLVLGIDVVILTIFAAILVAVAAVICALLKVTNEMGTAVVTSSFVTGFLMVCAYCLTIKVLELLFGAA